MAMKYVQMYFSYLEPLADLSDEQLGRVTRAMLRYGRDGTVPAFDGAESLAFKFMKSNFDRESSTYNEISEKRSECGKKGGAPKGNQNARKNKQNKQTSQEEKEEEKEEDEESSSKEDVVLSADADGMTTIPTELMEKLKQAFGEPTPYTKSRLQKVFAQLSPELAAAILDTCLQNNAASFSYFFTATNKVIAQGITTVEAYRAGHVKGTGGRNVLVDRLQPSGNNFLKDAMERPRRLKRKEGE